MQPLANQGSSVVGIPFFGFLSGILASYLLAKKPENTPIYPETNREISR